MKNAKALLLLSTIVLPLCMFSLTPPTKADSGCANV